MWDAVRNTYSTDMRALTFKQMNYADSYRWADALKDYYVCLYSIILYMYSTYNPIRVLYRILDLEGTKILGGNFDINFRIL